MRQLSTATRQEGQRLSQVQWLGGSLCTTGAVMGYQDGKGAVPCRLEGAMDYGF